MVNRKNITKESTTTKKCYLVIDPRSSELKRGQNMCTTSKKGAMKNLLPEKQ